MLASIVWLRSILPRPKDRRPAVCRDLPREKADSSKEPILSTESKRADAVRDVVQGVAFLRGDGRHGF